MPSESILARRARNWCSGKSSNQYFLAEIWGEQGSEGMKLRAPKPRHQARRSEPAQRPPETKY